MIIKKFNQLFFPHDKKSEHFKSLDGLRGVAVLFVLLSHSSNAEVYFHEYINFHKIGKVGVYLFFILSAYLLDRQIALAFISGKSSKLYWKNYALRRFLRIYPLFVIALLLNGVVTLFLKETVINEPWDIPLHMLLLKGESIFWSIPVEFKYYFISPFIMWFCHRFLKWHKTKVWLTLLIATAITIFIELYFGLSKVSTFRYFPIFLVGTALSIYELLYKKQVNQKIKPSVFSFLGIGSFFLIILTIPFYFEMVFGFKIDFQSPEYFLPYAILWGIILLSAKYGTAIIKKFLELKFLRFIGSISFSMYLFHLLFLNFVAGIGMYPPLQIYVFLLLTIVFSSLSYLFIERPLSRIRIYSKSITEKDLTEKRKEKFLKD